MFDFKQFAIESARREFGPRKPPSNTADWSKVGPLPTTVCTGWTTPRHPRIVLVQGDDSQSVSHGMCPACEKAMEEQ